MKDGSIQGYIARNAINQGQQTAQSYACGCIGPQRGEPVCPCQMRAVRIIDGRYVMIRDLGSAPALDPLAWPKIDPDRLADSWIGGV